MSLLGGIISGGLGLIGSQMQSNASRYNTDATNRANRELAEYQYSKDLEMWHNANEYNSPGAQMDRLKSAGLNPNLAYGSGSVAGNSASQLPKYQAPRMDYNYQPVDLTTALNGFMDLKMKSAQADLLGAQASNVQQQQVLNTARTSDTMARTARSRFDLMMAEMLKGYSLDAARLGVDRAKKQLTLMDISGRKGLQSIDESRQRMDWRSHDINRLMLDNQYRKDGLNPNDPAWMRLLYRNFFTPEKRQVPLLDRIFGGQF